MVTRRATGIIAYITWLGITLAWALGSSVNAAPYAAYVMDAATGETLFSKNADTRLHPASLTKMMTLYVTFGAVESGEISVDKMVTISQNAASEPPSKLGLRKGQKITLRYLIRAAAIKSANDAATAIGEAVSGSESAFAKRMTRTAKALGMLNSQFKNANGLTKSGHYSTAHDMSILGRHLFYDYPDYYHLFSRREIFVGVAKVRNTNRRFLAAYRGADGIKTGYTNAAGYNLTASAQHGNRRIIASVFGATSTPNRNLKMAKLLNLGFSKKATGTKVPLAPPAVLKDIKSLVLTTSPRPKPRPLNLASTTSLAAEQQTSINAALQEAAATTAKNAAQNQIFHIQNQNVIAPTFVPYTTAPLTKINWPPENTLEYSAMILTSQDDQNLRNATPPKTEPKVVTRMSTSGGRHFGVNLGLYPSRSMAERELFKIVIAESMTLGQGLRKVLERSVGYNANVMGLTQDQANQACRHLQTRAVPCELIGGE